MGVAAAVGGHPQQLVDAHRMHPGARRVLLERDPGNDGYWLILVRRCGAWPGAGPGSVIETPSLRQALHAVRMKFARPADAHTRLDVELALMLDRLLPRAK